MDAALHPCRNLLAAKERRPSESRLCSARQQSILLHFSKSATGSAGGEGKTRKRTPRRISTTRCAASADDRSGNGQTGVTRAPPRRLRVSEMSAEMKKIRAQIEEDEQVASLMRGLRGQNLNDSQFAADDVQMRLVQIDDAGELPLVYDPDIIAAYWGKRPTAVAQRVAQLLSVTSGFLSRLISDLITGSLKQNEVRRACEIREIVTSLGPAYIKLGQALSIRPDILSPAAMNELQKLCDKVPSFDNDVAMALIEEELGLSPEEIFSELSPSPIAAASLGQVYKGRLRSNGDAVAVKVQRPYVLETVTIDLFIIRKLGIALRRFPQVATDVVGLVDEWAARFFEELDYVNEALNTERFAETMKKDLPQVVVPKTYPQYTSRRVLVSGWIEGEKLSQSTAEDVGELVNVGVICYLKQLLDSGFFHADPHPGNLIRTPDGRLAVLDFGLMTKITEDQKYGMIEAISHLIHRDYNAIVKDFVLLGFIPEGVNLAPIMPVLARVFDQALEGGGAKGINFQELAADLAQITFDYPFRIPPYFALIIRAIGVLEGIALVGNPDFAIVDAAYPYIAQRLLTDPSPRLRQALRYTIYGKDGVFDADRFIDVMEAFETFADAANAGMGSESVALVPTSASSSPNSRALSRVRFGNSGALPVMNSPRLANFSPAAQGQSRAALSFLLSQEGSFFREFILDEIVKGIDALGREQINQLALSFIQGERRLEEEDGEGEWIISLPFPFPPSSPFPTPATAFLPSFAPIAPLPLLPPSAAALLPRVSEEDKMVLENLRTITTFLLGSPDADGLTRANTMDSRATAELVRELLPLLPDVFAQIVPEITSRLSSRIAARFLREVVLGA